MNKKELIKTLALLFGKKVKCELLSPNGVEWISTKMEIDLYFLFEFEKGNIRNVTMPQKAGVDYISMERTRQIEVEGFTSEHDAIYENGELVRAAACYATMPLNIYCYKVTDDAHSFVKLWPFPKEWRKPTPYNRIKELSKAGALIAAEIDRVIALNDKK